MARSRTLLKCGHDGGFLVGLGLQFRVESYFRHFVLVLLLLNRGPRASGRGPVGELSIGERTEMRESAGDGVRIIQVGVDVRGRKTRAGSKLYVIR